MGLGDEGVSVKALCYSGDGVTRHVLLIGGWALKVPRLNYGWRLFLQGLLCNMQEAAFGRTGWPELCPVLASVPGGLLVVMRRARVLTEEEFGAFDHEALCERPNYHIPAERKHDSFGWLDGRVVALDYGS